MAVCEVLKLGNSKLYEISEAVQANEVETLLPVVEDLHDTLMDFRAEYNAGRAIAAPQIGVMKRLIYMNIGERVAMFNPALTEMSREMFEVWDDCLCFPELLVKVLRHQNCVLTFRDERWREQSMRLSDDLSELLQHEADHLDGILAVSHAIDGKSFALRTQRKLL